MIVENASIAKQEFMSFGVDVYHRSVPFDSILHFPAIIPDGHKAKTESIIDSSSIYSFSYSVSVPFVWKPLIIAVRLLILA